MKLTNQQARQLVIHYAGLSEAPTGSCTTAELLALINRLGYVQLDPLQVVARAHDHILWNRCNQYRPSKLNTLLKQGEIFEHFCHDACVLPMSTLPYWSDQFKKLTQSRYWTECRQNPDNRALQKALMARISTEGCLRSNDFQSDTRETKKAIWTKAPHKKALDYLWLKGDLAVSKRVNFSKYYNLSSRIFPDKTLQEKTTPHSRKQWLMHNAFSRLGFATAGEVARFWDVYTVAESKAWCNKHQEELTTVQVTTAHGKESDYLVHSSQLDVVQSPPTPTSRLRIINPFDPLVRDRKRLAALFGFDYRIEIYTPPAERQYGYYVYPLLEGDTFVGRIEVKHNRALDQLDVLNLWPGEGVRFGTGRMAKLCSELERMRRFCGAKTVIGLKRLTQPTVINKTNLARL